MQTTEEGLVFLKTLSTFIIFWFKIQWTVQSGLGSQTHQVQSQFCLSPLSLHPNPQTGQSLY